MRLDELIYLLTNHLNHLKSLHNAAELQGNIQAITELDVKIRETELSITTLKGN